MTNSQSNNQFRVERIALREWLVLSVLMLLLTAGLLFYKTLERADLVLYDRLMQVNTRPARDDIIIVGIDSHSLSELGKWPWSRARHAELIKQIDAAQPLAIGMDFVFTEAEDNNPEQAVSGDQAFANAITQSDKVVLPLISENAGKGLMTVRPVPILASAARQLAHINLELDKDGVVRSIFLREGMNGEWWPHFALALADVGKNITPGTETNLPGNRLAAALRNAAPEPGTWQRDYQMHIPFAGSSGHFRSVPYVSVLRGEVPPAFFKNKYVLVGPTASAMADSFPTPVSGNEGMISGVEINANILAALLDKRSIVPAPLLYSLLFNLLAVGMAMSAYQLLSPRKALLATAAIATLAMAGSWLALRYLGYWVAPTATLLALIIAYPLWSWRRLEAAIRFLGEEFRVLDQEPHLLPEFVDQDEVQPARALTDTLEQSINAMREAVDRVRDLRQFISDSLVSLPDATLVTTTDGNVLLSNQPAIDYFAGIGIPKVNDALVPYLFANMAPPQYAEHAQESSFSWWDILDIKHTKGMSQGIEVRDPQGKDLLIKSAPCYNGDKKLVGWIVSLIDITSIRAAERSRDETLHFISHDMRAPQASILALLELQKDSATALPTEEFMSRIEKASRSTLGLADNFVQLARAESQDYRYEEADFQDILLVATEEMWSLAKNKNIRITTQIQEEEFPVLVDRSLMTRVLTNLLSNAIKYSPRDTTITCSLISEQHLADATIICSIADQGYGITRADQNKLFQRFQRFKTNEQPKNDGVGLGMVFVKAVLDRHQAKIDFTSTPNEGTTFHIRIPADLD
ncbi:CHASE2 domain-containing protein [Undibacterium sp. Ji49W]|uniref:CHASE2 domain-containing protein n=1 Tax=Undibacterium sp. Ji49W TaxID=3413040 RepID=UPI003BF3E8F6